jgi:hypothetical protein
MKRVLALAAALLLIVLATVARRHLDDGGSGDGDGAGRLVVACVPELADACAAIDDAEVRVEAPDDTIAALGSGTGPDAWVTFDPWPAIADLDAGRPVLDATPVRVAATELRLLYRRSRVLGDCTEASATWACAAGIDARRVVLPPPTTATGLLVLGHAAASYFHEVAGIDRFASNDFDDAFRSWLAALGAGAGDPVDDMLVLGNAGPIATGATAADIAHRVAPSARAADLTASAAGVAMAADVVVAGPAAQRLAGDADLLAALAELGFDPAGDRPPASTAPSAGVLVALRTLDQEVHR